MFEFPHDHQFMIPVILFNKMLLNSNFDSSSCLFLFGYGSIRVKRYSRSGENETARDKVFTLSL